MEVERCFGSMASTATDLPVSTHSSRSSTPFAFPFPSFASSLLEDTSTRLLGLLHPALFTDESFRCPICLAAFPSIWLLEQHTALQHVALGHFATEDKPFVCDQCGQSYRYRSAYIKHREQNHRARLPADKLFSCDVCGMQFRYLKSFKKHRLNHALERLHGKSDGVSSGVPESGNAANSYDSDIQSAENNASNDTVAESSNNQVSSSNENMTEENDIPRVTIKKENLYPDEEGTDENLTSPSEKDDSVDKTVENCDQDDTIDSIGFSLSSNAAGTSESCATAQEASILNFLRMDAAERQRERRFACPFCGKCVRSKENLKLHVRKHTGERPFVCLFCGRAFGGKSDLTRHLRIHTGERPYHCEMCGKCFARADYLSKHLTTHIHTPR